MSSRNRKKERRNYNTARTLSSQRQTSKHRGRFSAYIWIPIVVVALIAPVVAVIVFQSARANAMRSSDSDTTHSVSSSLPIPTVQSSGHSAVSESFPYPYFYPDTEVLVYTGSGDTGWQPMPFGIVPWGVEFLFEGRFYDVDPEGRVRVNLSVEANATNLAEADRPFEPYKSRWPEPEDLVRFVDQDNHHLFHNRAGTFQPGDRFWFQGVLYEGVADPGDPSGRLLRSTGYVLSNDGRMVSVEEFAIARGDSLDDVYGSQASSVVASDADSDRQPGNSCVVLASFRKSHDLPNGVVLSRNDNNTAQSSAGLGGTPTDFGFAGHRYDSSTGLIYMGARYYDPVLGRFISPDPTVPEPGNPQSLNRYSYVENNPVTFIDPYGLEKVIIVYGTYNDTNSFRAAAETQYQVALNAGYAEGDILLLAVNTDADLLAAIAGSNTNEIERVYVFSHGWGAEWEGGGLQLNNGPNRREDYSQFTAEDLDPMLRDRFAEGAEFHINACNVGTSALPQEIANAFEVTTIASAGPMKFWYLQQQVQRQWWFIRYNTWVDVAPGADTGSAATRWRMYEGDGEYERALHVEMKPYTGRGPFSRVNEDAYVTFEPQPWQP